VTGLRGLLGVIVALSVVATALPAVSALPAGGLYGGTVTVAVLADVATDPLTAGVADLEALGLAYDSLAKRSAVDQTPVPWLAMNWSLTANAATFHLRGDGKWADGAAITAADVAWSIERYAKPGVAATAGAGTVTVTFTANAGRFFGEWIYLPLAWKNGQVAPAGGSGPYVIQERVAGDHLTLAANPAHWAGRPYLDAVVYKVFANLGAAACGLVDGTATMLGFLALPNDLTNPRSCASGDTTLLNTTSLSIVRNPGLTHLYLGMNAAVAPLDEPALRRGVIQTLDKDLYALIEPAAYVEIADSLVVAGNFHWFNATVPRYRVDKVIVGTRAEADFDRVNNELDLAGYLDRNSDGWRERRDGTPFSVRLLAPSVATDIRKFTIAQNMWTNLGRIGIQTELVQDSWANITASVVANDFELAFGLYTGGKDSDFYYDLFHSSRIASGTNLVNLDDAAIDAAVLATRNQIDPAVRQQLARDMQGRIAEDVPWAPVLHYKAIDVYAKEPYTGWVNTVGGVNNFWTFVELHVAPQGSLRVSLSLQFARVEAGKPVNVVVVVTDQDGLTVAGADVELTGGAFTPATGVTGGDGLLASVFTATAVTATTDIEITASASRPGYDASSATAPITVTPARRLLRVTVERPLASAQIASGESAQLTVSVLDTSTLLPVPGASVAISVAPANFGAAATPASGTTGTDGRLALTFSGDVSVETYFLITARVTAPGYEEPAPASTTVVVERHEGSFPQPSTPGPDTATLVVLVVLLGYGYLRLQGRRRKRT
jgi:peptide/nickel transport system substrate-binding protein